MSTAGQPHSFFLFETCGRAFNDSLTRLKAEFQKKFISDFILPGNTYRLYHGRTWSNPANAGAGSGDAATSLAPPLLWELLYEYAAIHVETNNLDGRPSA